MNQVDQENQRVVFDLLDTAGWPTNVSDNAHRAIFLVIDHADDCSQKKYLPMMAEQTANGLVSKANLATLQDRILMHENKKQIYGTQTKSSTIVIGDDKKSIIYMWPIENPASIDSLRATVGLPSLASYIELFKSEYGEDVIWDPSLTHDEVIGKLNLNTSTEVAITIIPTSFRVALS